MKLLKQLKRPRYFIPILAILLLVLIPILTQRPVEYKEVDSSVVPMNSTYQSRYDQVRNTWDDVAEPSNISTQIDATNMTGVIADQDTYNLTDDAVEIKDGESVEFTVNVAQAGVYEIEITQRDVSSSILPNRIGVLINGMYQYEEARTIELITEWAFTRTDFARDRYGNEILPNSDKNTTFLTHALYDSTALNSRPLQFNLDAGDNTIRIDHKAGHALISDVEISSVERIPTYDAYLDDFEDADVVDDVITVGAESFISKTNPSTRLTSINDASATKYDSNYSRLNSIDGYSFRSGNDQISYEIEAEEAGFYYIAFKYNQDYLMQMPVFREIAINGEVPFENLAMVPFQYTSSYENMILGGEETPYKIYLDEGVNTLSLRVVLDPYQNAYEHVTNMMDEITTLSLEIKKLTGNQSDQYRTWELETYIPDIESRLTNWIDTLETLNNGLATYSIYDEPGELTHLRLAIEQLTQLREDIDDIPNNMMKLADGDASTTQLLGTMAQVLLENGLDLEQMNIVGDVDDVPAAEANIFVRSFESVKRFFLSFTESDYAVSETDEDVIEIWVNYPRQYVEIMQQIIDSEFTAETGIQVKLALMPDENKLILANAANRPPDIALGVNHWVPYEFAIRNASLDLRQFDGYEEVVSNYAPGVMIPYAFEEGIYGLPQTQNFWVTFYREDLMDTMNLPVPETWEDVIEILPELQRLGMNYFEPIAQFPGFKPFVATIPFIYQFGGQLYDEDGMNTLINSEENLTGMRMMTDLFTVYDMPKQVPNFYNHFRAGTLPIGIGDLATYLQLTIAAPELAGKWNIAPHPGVLNEDTGEIERWAASGAQSLMILSDTDQPDEAWAFTKWWMSTEIQVDFAERLQTTYGTEFLWNTANLEAFRQLSLPPEHIDVILEQWEYAMEASRIPGYYMVEREISNAWNRIIFDDANPRIALDEAVKTSNREIIYRMEEFGYAEDGVPIRSYRVPTIYNIDYWLKEHDDDE